MAMEARPGLPPSLKLRVLKHPPAVVLAGPATARPGIEEGSQRAILLQADAAAPGKLTVQAAQVPPPEQLRGADEPWVAMWNLAPEIEMLDPLDPFALDLASTASPTPVLDGRLNLRQTQLYEVQAAIGRIWRLAASELSLEWEPRELDAQLAGLGWDFQARAAQAGLELAAGARSFSACPGDADLASVRWYGAAGRQGEIRRQAAQAMPLFAGVIGRSPALRRCVDRQESLLAQLRRSYPALGSGGLKRLGRIAGGTAEQAALGEAFAAAQGEDVIGVNRQRRLSLAGAWKSEEAIAWLEGLAKSAGGVDLVPSSDTEWAACSAIWSGMLMPMQAHMGGDSMRIEVQGGKWQALQAALARDLEWPEGEPPGRSALNTAIVDAVELADQLAADIILPVIDQAVVQHCGMRTQGHLAAVHALCHPDTAQAARLVAIEMLVPARAKQPCRAVAAAVRAGLTRLTRLEGHRSRPEGGAAGETDASRGWAARNWEIPLASGEVQVANGATFRFIHDIDSLKAEGSSMRHCIGRDTMPYWKRCWAGDGLAAHVTPAWPERGHGQHGATAFFELVGAGAPGDAPALRLHALHGFANSGVNRTGHPFRVAVDQLLAMQAAGELAPNRRWGEFRQWAASPEARRLRGAGEEVETHQTRLHTVCGRDPADHEITRALWGEWRQVIPGAGGIDAPARAVWRSEAARQVLAIASPATYEAMLNPRPPERQPAAAMEAGA